MTMNKHEAIFAAAWDRKGNTSIELNPLDVNQVVSNEYEYVVGLSLTRTQLWEMETKKAARPDLFIPEVIRLGTARSWGHRRFDSGDEFFIRVSEQRLWLQPDDYGTVIEACYLNHASQQVTFIGLPEVKDDSGQTITASTEQPLFHVVHGASARKKLHSTLGESSILQAMRTVHFPNDSSSCRRLRASPGILNVLSKMF